MKENPCVFEMKYMAKKFMKGSTVDDSYFICKKLMYVTVLFMYQPRWPDFSVSFFVYITQFQQLGIPNIQCDQIFLTSNAHPRVLL